MPNDSQQKEFKLHWKWVILSVLVGLIIVGSSYYLIAPVFHNKEILALVMLVGFILMGAIIGYFSPGNTINEVTLGGGLVMLIMLWLLYFFKAELKYSVWANLFLFLLGVAFSWVGGWAGEKIQASSELTEEEKTKKFLWKWVLIGGIIGFALNILLVLVLATIFSAYIYKSAFAGFAISFMTTGFIVGIKSPGITLKEPAVAGLLVVILDWVFLNFIIKLSVTPYLMLGLAIGFLLALFGAYLGEKFQKSLKPKQSE